MDISEVLIEENNQTNKRPARRRDAGYLPTLGFFSLSILHFTLPAFYSIILLCFMYQIELTQIEFNIITHLVHIVISLFSLPPPRQSVQPSHTTKEDNKYEKKNKTFCNCRGMACFFLDAWMDGWRMFVKL